MLARGPRFRVDGEAVRDTALAMGQEAARVDMRGPFMFSEDFAYMQEAVPSCYFGIGNETPRTEPRDFYIVRRERYRFAPGVVFRVAPRTTWTVGAVAQFTETDLRRPTLARDEQPYGFGRFAEIGAETRLELDARNHPVYPTWGVRGFAELRVGFEQGGNALVVRVGLLVAGVQLVPVLLQLVAGVVEGFVGVRKCFPGTLGHVRSPRAGRLASGIAPHGAS